jgi:starch synthase
MKIAFVTSEAVPFGKTGGLGDVAGSLPKALKNLNKKNQVAVFLPYYSSIIDQNKYGKKIKVVKTDLWLNVGMNRVGFAVRKFKDESGVDFYFIENYDYFGRPEIYGPSNAGYFDNGERFVFFSQAVLIAMQSLEFKADVVHTNDWGTALVPVYMKINSDFKKFFEGAKTVFTIHNIDYQGIVDKKIMDISNIPWTEFTPEKLEFFDNVNFLKAGVNYSDVVTTVSKKYSQEIQENWFISRDVIGTLQNKKDSLFGIVNGIDYEEWNPETDAFIAKNYKDTTFKNKAKCKEDLRKVCNLETNDGAILAIVSRLVKNKGFDIIKSSLEEILWLYPDLQLVLLGTGETEYEDFFRYISAKYENRVSINIKFSNELAHKIYAGSDIFLMPSLSEACGLSQLISFRYGTVPIVNPVGGLFDTVHDYNEKTKEGSGFTMKECSHYGFVSEIKRAMALYADKTKWNKLAKNIMKIDSSWDKAGQEYLEIYKKI